MSEWKYGNTVRRAVTMNPVQYVRVMYVGPAKTHQQTHFVGIQLSEPPPLRAGEWSPGSFPPVGTARPRLRRDLFELDRDE